MKRTYLLAALASATFFAHTMSASVVGNLFVTNCAGGGVVVTATTIDWLLPLGGGNGCIQADTGTTVTFTGGSIVSGEQGTIKDITIGGAVPAFMVFTGPSGTPPVGSGSLNFDLSMFFPAGLPACTAGMANNTSCAVAGGGPFVLTKTAVGTTVTLSATGTVSDGTTPASNWNGSYTTQFTGLAPIDIQNFITGVPDTNTGLGCVPGTCTSTYSGTFAVTIGAGVPEPGSMGLIGFGLIGLATLMRRRKK